MNKHLLGTIIVFVFVLSAPAMSFASGRSSVSNSAVVYAQNAEQAAEEESSAGQVEEAGQQMLQGTEFVPEPGPGIVQEDEANPGVCTGPEACPETEETPPPSEER